MRGCRARWACRPNTTTTRQCTRHTGQIGRQSGKAGHAHLHRCAVAMAWGRVELRPGVEAATRRVQGGTERTRVGAESVDVVRLPAADEAGVVLSRGPRRLLEDQLPCARSVA